ncbi:Short-chain dehydrogenase/reductase SDR [Trypanosoma melophagium]|uniref:Short-chain dehydrogenase/reductase SDR n=1 Tax=Trypanosoma melophagium TaxID=715481 RepID=UPI00351A4640|nr:Short-chain dehydrogenase/reductase SDR [Trypanosoma melophagium]
MRIGYKSEVGAVCSACVAGVCFALLPYSLLTVAVPLWLVIQRQIARGSRNRVQPPHKGDKVNINNSNNSTTNTNTNTSIITQTNTATASEDSQNGNSSSVLFSHDMTDEERPVAVVTGTNSGIGYYTAVGLAVEGYRVVCTCRSASLSETTAAKIKKEAQQKRDKCKGNQKYAETPETVFVDGRFSLECDDFESVRGFVEKFQLVYKRLDVLVNNAGMMRKQLEFSRFNPQLELHTAVNFLGPLLLTELLIPLIQQSHGRVVYVASAAHRFPQMLMEPHFRKNTSGIRINGRLLEALKALNQGESHSDGPLKTSSLGYAFVRYGTSKLLNIYHAHYIAHHYKVPVCSLHPGCVGTNFSKDLMPTEFINRIYQYACLLFLKSWEEGAQTTLHCAMCNVDELKPVKPPSSVKQTEFVSPYFVECGNQTLESLLQYGWDLEEAERIILWGKHLVGLTAKEE